MKRNNILIGLALGMAVVLVGCSSNSPTAPKQPTPATYGISLTLSTPVAGINESVTAMAFVTVGGSNAPDGTSVTFTLLGNAYFVLLADPGAQVVTMTTNGGRASVGIIASPGGGAVKVTASVPNKSDSKIVTFTGGSAVAAIFSVMPNRAPAMTAGTQVVIHGQGLYLPQSVTFVEGTTSYPGQIVSFSADGTSITVSTPQAPVGAATIQVALGGGGSVSAVGLFTFYDTTPPVDQLPPVLYSVSPVTGSASGGEIITLTGAHFVNLTTVTFSFTDPTGGAKSLPAQIASKQLGSGGANDTAQVVVPRASVNAVTQTIYVDLVLGSSVGGAQTYPRAFAYVPDVTTPPVIYSISPTFGSVQGHETVTIYGANFVQPLTVQIGTVNETVVSVSGDGTTITIMTQPVPGTAPTTAQDVTVTTNLGVATLKSAFTYLEGQAPQLYALSPNNGPIEGGTRVTITGIGFQYPVQVLFGTQQAVVVSTNYDQVVCTSPSISASQPTTPTTVQVSVTNITSGKISQNTLPFQYGQAMFISGISPMEGPADAATTVTITGQGFVAPVRVTFNGNPVQQWPVLSVAGTQIVAKSVPYSHECANNSGTLTVTNLDSNLHADSGQKFTYKGVNPLITSVVIDGSGNTVQQFQPAGAVTCTRSWTSHTVAINGSGFSTSGVNVTFTGSSGGEVGPIPVAAANITASQVTLNLPELTAIQLNKTQCTVGTSTCGEEWLPTPLSVKVTNNDSQCFDTLSAAMVITPCDGSCRLNTVTSLTIALASPGPQPVGGAGFGLNITISPAQTTATTVSFTCNPNFTCNPVTIPATLTTGLATIMASAPVTSGAIVATSGSGSCQVTSNALSVTAQTSLTVSVTNNSGGTVTATTGGTAISCPGTCVANNVSISPVTLFESPSGGSAFEGWGGDCSSCSTNSSCVLTMNTSKSCTASFTYALTVGLAGNSGGHTLTSNNPSGLSCTPTCTLAVPAGSNTVYVYSIGGTNQNATWSGDCSGTGTANFGPISMTTNRSCTATYPWPLTMTISSGTGQVSASTLFPGSDASPCTTGTCNWLFDPAVQTLNASGFGTSVTWGGDCASCGTASSCPINVDAAKGCTATFTP